MSLRNEQYNSLRKTREFLRLLMTPQRPKRAKEIKEMAYSCLRHFPFLTENGEPMWSQDPFTKDEFPCKCKGYDDEDDE